MLRPRVVPCLLVSGAGLVKTRGFTEPRYIGDPINAVKIYNEKEADELIVLDIDATSTGVPPNFRLIGHLAVECRMPLCYGGGVKTLAQAREIVRLGVEKVALGSAAVENPELVRDVADEIGRQSVVAVLDVRRTSAGGEWFAYTHNGRSPSGRVAADLAAELEDRGAGEILVNSIDNDGMMAGYDLDLARRIRRAVKVPLTILGGAGALVDIEKLIAACGVVGAAAGSLFVYKGSLKAVLINYPSAVQKEELFRAAASSAAALSP